MSRSRPSIRRPVAVVAALLALVLPPAVCPRDLPLGWSADRLEDVHRSTLPPSLDADRDGLLDAEETELARRFAPLVTLHADDAARPASTRWLLGRAGVQSISKPGRLPLGGYDARVRRGSSRPQDWVTYVHVFPSREGGVLMQYWFFYPYNDGPLLFSHEADWEHITVGLDRARRPLGVWAARHHDNAPGRFRAWSSIRKVQGTHPEVLSALGTHATYFDLAEVPWYDRAARCEDLDEGSACRHPRWRTWEGGGLQQLGERQAPRDPVTMSNAGRWGSASLLPGRGAPFGPSFQRSWCVGGATGCGMYGAF